MKIFEIYFKGVYPVGSDLIIAAKDKEEALKIAKETIKHTTIKGFKEIDISKSGVIHYASGEY